MQSPIIDKEGHMNARYSSYLTAAVLAVLTSGISSAAGTNKFDRIKAELRASEEVPFVSSENASGSFKATIDDDAQTISFELSYDGLEGAPLFAHIHIGDTNQNGAIPLFLCSNVAGQPAAPALLPPACPALTGSGEVTVSGMLTPANILSPGANAQGIAGTTATTNEFAELVKLIRGGHAYVNLHTTRFPAGEIRGQTRITLGFGRDRD
jgi:hypothetical protein